MAEKRGARPAKPTKPPQGPPPAAPPGGAEPIGRTDRDRLAGIRKRVRFDRLDPSEQFDIMAAQFNRETGMIAPGKDAPAAMNSHDRAERNEEWRGWSRHWHAQRSREAKEDRAFLLSLVDGEAT